ncbi:rhodanese-related sulfurtransferase [Salsuginibacillus halophilus]|uniref:Rhodanese-related sulfurtransferase n=1 Tax=Salsuginibacillus halophilus TaxID=517424 RepID=A0A2P8HLH7_9BACI|nr:sulfurtransferase TusA family protein [Salsuginibacillus halophilus]PSL47074.1 rhodanese-related sulfurtransferase [Salsuginibacillus halophilus]
MTIQADHTIDAKNLSCPMPIVKTKKAMDEAEPGEVLQVEATDPGSLADMQGWAQSTGHNYLGSTENEGVLIHYVRKSNPEEVKDVSAFEAETTNDELKQKLEDDNVTVLDVREPAEYAFGHVPGAVSIPLGELSDRINELEKNQEIHVICRTGNRSNFAAHQLTDQGFQNVYNVVPGMSEWDGPTEKNQ